MLTSDAFRYQLNNLGRVLRIRYFTETVGSVYDDDRTLALSGNSLYVSGLVQEINPTPNSRDQSLVEQGRIGIEDKKFYVAGSLETTSGTKIFTIAISGIDNVFREMAPGISEPQLQDNNAYKLIYGRMIEGGSLV